MLDGVETPQPLVWTDTFTGDDMALAPLPAMTFAVRL